MLSQIELIKKYGLQIRGHLGQHLLIDQNIARKIVALLGAETTKGVLEIGPGLGALTGLLLEAGHSVLAVEQDKKFVDVLRQELGPYGGDLFKIETGDILKKDLKIITRVFSKQQFPLQAISNIPYYITAPILMHLCAFRGLFSQAVVMMQKEVAERLLAMPGTKSYGRLTLAVRYAAEARKAFDVPRSCFTPQPEVESTVVTLRFRERSLLKQAQEKALFELIKLAFSQRRKTFISLLTHQDKGLSKEKLIPVFEELGLDPKSRGEELLLKDFIELNKRIR